MKRSKSRLAFDVVAIAVFAAGLLYVFLQWSTLPSEIPTHYNLAGVPDGWGDKWTVFLPLTIGFMMWIVVSLVEKHPHTHNYIGLTEENRPRLYKNSQLLANLVKNEVLIFLTYVTIGSIRLAKGKESVLGAWEMPLFLLVLFGTIAFLFVRGLRLR